jgi:hypothetical protein
LPHITVAPPLARGRACRFASAGEPEWQSRSMRTHRRPSRAPNDDVVVWIYSLKKLMHVLRRRSADGQEDPWPRTSRGRGDAGEDGVLVVRQPQP